MIYRLWWLLFVVAINGKNMKQDKIFEPDVRMTLIISKLEKNVPHRVTLKYLQFADDSKFTPLVHKSVDALNFL